MLLVGVNTQVRERVYTFPDVVDLGGLRVGESRPAQTLMVYQTGGRDFSVTARSDIRGLDVQAERGAGGDRVQLTVLFARERTTPEPIDGTIFLATNDPDFPELRVPVRGAVLGD